MPGNKSSGRKRGVVEETDSICDESLKPQEKRKVGQPQGETTTPILISILPANEEETKEPPQKQPSKRTSLARVPTNVVELNSRNSELKEFYNQLAESVPILATSI